MKLLCDFLNLTCLGWHWLIEIFQWLGFCLLAPRHAPAFCIAWDKQIRDAHFSDDSLAEGPHGYLWQILQTLPRFKPGKTVVVIEVGVWWMGDVIYKKGSKGSEGPHAVPDRLRRYRGDPLGQCRPGDPRCPLRLNPNPVKIAAAAHLASAYNLKKVLFRHVRQSR